MTDWRDTATGVALMVVFIATGVFVAGLILWALVHWPPFLEMVVG